MIQSHYPFKSTGSTSTIQPIYIKKDTIINSILLTTAGYSKDNYVQLMSKNDLGYYEISKKYRINRHNNELKLNTFVNGGQFIYIIVNGASFIEGSVDLTQYEELEV